MSATFFGGEIKYTKRYRLGQLLSTLTRHFLLMTATPHNGKEEDFQLFMALLDGDRFEGRFRDGVHAGRRLRPDAPDGEGEPAQVRRHAALPRAHRLHRALQALRRRGAALQGGHRLRARGVQPRRGARRTTSAPARSASRSPSCSGASPRRRRRSTSRCAAAASGWRSGCASWSCCSAARQCRADRCAGLPCSTPKTSRTSKKRPTTRSRRPRRRSSTRPRRRARIAELKIEIATLDAPRGAGRRRPPQRRGHASGASSRSLLGEIFTPAALARPRRRSRPCPTAPVRSRSPRPRRARSSSSSPSTATR